MNVAQEPKKPEPELLEISHAARRELPSHLEVLDFAIYRHANGGRELRASYVNSLPIGNTEKICLVFPMTGAPATDADFRAICQAARESILGGAFLRNVCAEMVKQLAPNSD